MERGDDTARSIYLSTLRPRSRRACTSILDRGGGVVMTRCLLGARGQRCVVVSCWCLVASCDPRLPIVVTVDVCVSLSPRRRLSSDALP